MAIEIPRLVAACAPELMRELMSKLLPDQSNKIDWRLQGRALGYAVRDAVHESPTAWVKLQQISGLAEHGNTAIIRSVLHYDRGLSDQFDELDINMQTAAVWLAVRDNDLFEHCLSALHADNGLGKRSWQAFRVRLPKRAEPSFSQDRMKKFEDLVRTEILECTRFDKPGELEAHHFRRVFYPDDTHSRKVLNQVTLFAEARSVTEDVFEESRVQTRARKKVDSISVIHDRQRGELDVVSLGGKNFVQAVARAYLRAFWEIDIEPDVLIRRKVNFEILQRPFKPIPDDKSRFVGAKVDEIRVRSPAGGLYTFDAKVHRNSDFDAYDMARRDLGERTPFENPGWEVVSARIILFAAPIKPHLKPKARSVELKPNGRTNLSEQNDEDRFIADKLLTLWGLLEPAVNGDGDD